MARWELIEEIRDTGYYIGWSRKHPYVHRPVPMQPMSKASLVQIGGRKGMYKVKGLTFAHSIFGKVWGEHEIGLKLFDKTYIVKTLEDARSKATELKKEIAKTFDSVTHSNERGELVSPKQEEDK